VDKAVTRFFKRVGAGIVRIHKRAQWVDPFNCFYATITKSVMRVMSKVSTKEYLFRRLWWGRPSMGVHESQKPDLREPALAGAVAFSGWALWQMRECFGDFGVAE